MSKRAERKNVVAGKEGDLGSDDKMLERGFERWLNGQLHRIYDPVLSEALPFLILLVVMSIRPWGLFGTVEELDRV